MKKMFLAIIGIWLGFGAGQAAPLPAADAFSLKVNTLDANTAVINWTIAPGYFLYKERITILTVDNQDIKIGTFSMPEPEIKIDKTGHQFKVYRKILRIAVPIMGVKSGESVIQVHYQGCSDAGFCYPPIDKAVQITIDNDLHLERVAVVSPTMQATTKSQSSNAIETMFSNKSPWMLIVSFFGFGLLLAFTPCILPMIPVLSGVIMGHGSNISTKKAFGLSLSYVISMALTYAVIGAVIAELGSNLQIIMQTPLVISAFSLLFVILAFSMFGYYDIKLPLSWQTKLAEANRHQARGHYLGAAIMGSLSILILSPCVTPPLIGVLGYIAHDGNVVMGAICLFFLGLGMGMPLLLIGTSAGRFLPKAGSWMNEVKSFFGVLLLAMAIILMSSVVTSMLMMIAWAGLLIYSSFVVGHGGLNAYPNRGKLRLTLALLLLTYGLLIVIGASQGHISPLKPLYSSNQPNDVIENQLPFTTVKSINELNHALKSSEGQIVFLDFYADWCNSCKIMETTVFSNPKVALALKDYKLVKVDLSKQTDETIALQKQFNVIAPPTFIILNNSGQEKEGTRVIGDVTVEELLNTLDKND